MAASGGEQAVLSSSVCCVHSGIIIAWNWDDGGTMPLLAFALREQRYVTFRKMFKTYRGISYMCKKLVYVYIYLAFTA